VNMARNLQTVSGVPSRTIHNQQESLILVGAGELCQVEVEVGVAGFDRDIRGFATPRPAPTEGGLEPETTFIKKQHVPLRMGGELSDYLGDFFLNRC
jgi:hypothetical protein